MTFSDSSPIPATPLHLALNALMARHVGVTFPSCSLAVLFKGQPVAHGAWGESEGTAACTDTLFDIASISKLFTTTVFLRCVSSGLVGLDDALCTVLPAFVQSGSRPVEGGQDPHTLKRHVLELELSGQSVDPRRVTFRHLLTHTSGLPAWRDVFAIAGSVPHPPEAKRPLEGDARWSQALPAIYNYPFIAQPGQHVVYSDIGFMLLGQAVQVLCSQPLDQVIEAQVLSPLALERTMFNPVNSGRATLAQTAPTEMDLRWRQRRVWGEVHDENACGLGGVAGHAGLFATAMEVARFGQAWMDAPEQLGVDAELAAQAKTEQAVTDDVRRGLGFVIKSRDNASAGDRFSEDTFGHTGFTGTTLWVDPQRQCVVSCLSNGVYLGRASHAPHAFRRELHDLLAQSL